MTDVRPRDALGRPLPADADDELIAEPVIDITGLDDAQVWSAAIAYLDRGLPFHGHEVFEQRWRTCDARERSAWRGLAQWGAALTHDARGNAEGARRLAARCLETLADAPHAPTAIDIERVRMSCSMIDGMSSPSD